MKKPSSPQPLPPKLQQIITAARDLFCMHGITRVKIEEICKKAGVSRVTFYKYFKNKWDIAETVIDAMFDEGIRDYYDIAEEKIPFNQKLEKLLLLITHQIDSFGPVLFDDLLSEDSSIHTHYLEKQSRATELTLDFFTRARKEGHIQKDIKEPLMLFYLKRTLNDLNDPEFISIMPNIEDRAKEIATKFFYGFTGPPD